MKMLHLQWKSYELCHQIPTLKNLNILIANDSVLLLQLSTMQLIIYRFINSTQDFHFSNIILNVVWKNQISLVMKRPHLTRAVNFFWTIQLKRNEYQPYSFETADILFQIMKVMNYWYVRYSLLSFLLSSCISIIPEDLHDILCHTSFAVSCYMQSRSPIDCFMRNSPERLWNLTVNGKKFIICTWKNSYVTV